MSSRRIYKKIGSDKNQTCVFISKKIDLNFLINMLATITY